MASIELASFPILRQSTEVSQVEELPILAIQGTELIPPTANMHSFLYLILLQFDTKLCMTSSDSFVNTVLYIFMYCIP